MRYTCSLNFITPASNECFIAGQNLCVWKWYGLYKENNSAKRTAFENFVLKDVQKRAKNKFYWKTCSPLYKSVGSSRALMLDFILSEITPCGERCSSVIAIFSKALMQERWVNKSRKPLTTSSKKMLLSGNVAQTVKLWRDELDIMGANARAFSPSVSGG